MLAYQTLLTSSPIRDPPSPLLHPRCSRCALALCAQQVRNPESGASRDYVGPWDCVGVGVETISGVVGQSCWRTAESNCFFGYNSLWELSESLLKITIFVDLTY